MSSPHLKRRNGSRATLEVAGMRQENVEGRGRGMVATRALQGGEVLLRESPPLLYQEAEAAESSSFCGFCMRVLEPGCSRTSCPSCPGLTTFCSPACLDAAQSTSHTPRVCKAIRSLESAELSAEKRTLARFLVAAYNLALEDPKGFEKLLELEGQQCAEDLVKELHDFLIEAFQGSDVDPVEFSVEMTGSLLAKDACNTFGLMAPSSHEGERKVRGYAIYGQASMFNHDCLPNACRFEYIDRGGEGNTDVIVRALHDIEEGTEVCLSYFPVDWPYGDRQKKLNEEYGFHCKCERCKVEAEWKDEDEDDDGEDDEESEEDDEKVSAGNEKLEDAGENADADDDDFGHAIFFVKYLCPVGDCGGTMAPLPPGEVDQQGLKGSMECNFCGHVRSEEEFYRDLEENTPSDD